MIGSVSYVGMNVRVWYMCSGSMYVPVFILDKGTEQ